MRTLLIPLLISLVCVAVPAQTKQPQPAIQEIADGMVWRQSTEITITNVFGFKKSPAIGEPVTVVVLGLGNSPFDLRLLSAKSIENACDETLPREWEVEFEPVTEKKLFEAPSPENRSAEYPFDVVILYPAVKFARQLTKNQLKLASLPKGTYLNAVKAAIDLDNDRKPDIVITEYCCDTPKKAPGNCDLTCSKTFKKVKNVWKLVGTSSPC